MLLATLASLGSLFALTGLRQFFIQPLDDNGVNLVWFLIQVAPLLLPLPGLIRGSLHSTFFVCMASMLYFIHGTLIVFDDGIEWLGAAEIVFSLALCATTSVMIRRMREAQAAGESN